MPVVMGIRIVAIGNLLKTLWVLQSQTPWDAHYVAVSSLLICMGAETANQLLCISKGSLYMERHAVV